MKKVKNYLITIVSCAVVAGSLALFVPRVAQTQVFSSPMRDVDNPARQPISLQPALISVFANADNGLAGSFYQVPAGKRLIIDYIGYSDNVPAGKTPLVIFVSATGSGGVTSFAQAEVTTFSPYVNNPGFRLLSASQEVQMFGNPGDQINIVVITDGGPADVSLHGFSINGYLVNLP